ncbi:MAG: hypothetical protein HQL96_15565 [Magnetococcales bacterium]|nr:hypothetical protein [Magnetococcales bacterium]
MSKSGWMALLAWVWVVWLGTAWAVEGNGPESPAIKVDRPIQVFTPEELAFSKLTMGYYKNPDPEKLMNAFLAIKDILAFFQHSKRTADDGRAVIASQITAVFFASMIRKQPALASTFGRMVTARGTDPHKIVLADAVAMSGVKDREEILNKLFKSVSEGFLNEQGKDPAQVTKDRETLFARMRQQPVLDLTKVTVVHPGQLDLLWSAFFATGEKDYVVRVAKKLDFWLPQEELSRKMEALNATQRTPEIMADVRRHALSAAAGWSLAANAKRFPEVKSALEKFAASEPGTAGTAAKSILQLLKAAN